MVTPRVETDYLVVGAGAMGMAFTDALIDHADVHVTLVDRRDAPGGHWRDAYPFVRLHQASLFYGVASTVLGTGAIQRAGPEAGLHGRATGSEITRYYDDVMQRFLGSGQVTFLAGSEYRTDGSVHQVTSRSSGEVVEVAVRRRVVDATYLAPTIPATSPPPFGVADGAKVVAVNELASVGDVPDQVVIVGSGKTATDAIVWLLTSGVEPDRIVWVRPRDPWMLDRAVVQPDPAVITGLAADTMAAAAEAASRDELFLRLEAAGVMLRIDPDTVPTMAKTPTLGRWELELLRTVEHVVRLGHVHHVRTGELVLQGGVVPLAREALVVHCAADGLAYPPLVDMGTGWDPLADDPGGVPLLLRRARRVRGGHPRRRPRTQPALSAQRPRGRPRGVGADAGARGRRRHDLQRRTGHRRVGERLRPEPVARHPRPAGGTAGPSGRGPAR
jgi:hypothetical protein